MRYGYNHTIGVVLFFLLFIVGGITSCYGQTSPNTPSGYSIDVTTGNLITNSGLTSTSGWTTSGMAGSPTPDGYIFSYSSGTVYQTINAANIPVSYQNTSAVFITGISYGFQYRFQCAQSIGLACETGTVQDTLNSTFTYYNKDGTVAYTAYYGLGTKNQTDGNPAYNPIWQSLAETYTFTGAKTLSDIGYARLSITGMDGGFWACNPNCYGPQIKNAYMNVNYSVDPCILNPAFNSGCPGFQNIIQGVKTPTFYNSYNIAQSLPHIGGGVVLHGYEYGFNWWNFGSCYAAFLFWCTDWRTDGGGTVNFRITDSSNNVMFNNSWYREGNNQSGSYNSRYLFTESRNTLDMGRVDWWVTGGWNNFAVFGWTKPIWTPDPCYTNGLYSPNCTNFKETLNQVIVDVKEQQEKIASLSSSTITPTSSITTTINNPITTNPSVSVVTEVSETTKATTTNVSTQMQKQDSTSLALDIIGKNKEREKNIAMSASQSAVRDAAEKASVSVKESLSVAQEAVSTSTKSLEETTVKEVARTITETRPTQQTQILLVPGSNTTAVSMQRQQQIQEDKNAEKQQDASVVTIQIVNTLPTLTPSNIPNFENGLPLLRPAQETAIKQEQPVVSYAPSAQQIPETIQEQKPEIFVTQQPVLPVLLPASPTQTIVETTQQISQPIVSSNQPIIQNIPEQPQIQPSTIASIAPVINVEVQQMPSNFLTNKADPINELIEQKINTNTEQGSGTKTQTVKSNVQDNDAAAGVSINTIAVTPVGFNAYNIALTDAAFYAPKEIYRNQKVVDNVRLLRQLASDRLHQQMVDQQYRR